MIGFEILINNKVKLSIASDSSQLFLTSNQHNILLFPSGISNRQEQIKWSSLILKVGDRLKIKVKEIDKITPPVLIEKGDFKSMKESYFMLKTKLEMQGLI